MLQQHPSDPAESPRLPLRCQDDAGLSAMCDALSAALGRESAYTVRDYLRDDSGGITADDRTKLVDWCYDVVDRCQIQRETVAIAMNLVGRVMSACPPSSVYLRHRDEYQLLTVASLYVAVKLAERTLLSSEAMSIISQGMYSVGEVEAVELEILSTLGWRISPPTPAALGHLIVDILQRSTSSQVGRGAFDLLRDEIAYQTELAVRDYRLSGERPGTIAMASLINAVERVGDDIGREILSRGQLSVVMEFWRQFSFDDPRTLVEARERLAELVRENDEDDMTASTDEAVISVVTAE